MARKICTAAAAGRFVEGPVKHWLPVCRRFEQVPADDKEKGHVEPVKVISGAAPGAPRQPRYAQPFGYVDPLLPVVETGRKNHSN
jgi:hypothetical protein